jgi:hypothetical protein
MDAPWTIAGDRARLAAGPCAALVDFSNPAAGLHEICWQGRSVRQWKVLGVETAAESLSVDIEAPRASDSGWYARGNDLVATYRETGKNPLRTQIYWRVVEGASPGALAIDLHVSVQTSQLDANPLRDVLTCLPDCPTWRIDQGTGLRFSPIDTTAFRSPENRRLASPAGWLFRPQGEAFSYVEMVHPDDLRGDRLTSVSAADSTELRLVHPLFAGDLEKGVILRGRVRGVFVPRAEDERLALQTYRTLLDARLPLTT